MCNFYYTKNMLGFQSDERGIHKCKRNIFMNYFYELLYHSFLNHIN